MSHDCQQLQRQLDSWPLLASEERAQLAAEAMGCDDGAGCADCAALVAATRRLAEVLENGRRQHLELRYDGLQPDFAAASPSPGMPRSWRSTAVKRLLPLAALLFVALGLRWAWIASSASVQILPVAADATSASSPSALALPPSPHRPATPSLGSLSVSQLRRPSPPGNARSLTFTSPPRPSAPAEHDHQDAERAINDH